jgi:WD40 repeat protein/serine/threonine protein kinase
MPATRQCPKCGAELYNDALEGLCDRCLARTALGPLSGQGDRASTTRFDFGDYELIQEIGRGGMGIVYKARQISLNRIVAVKMLLCGQFSSGEFVKRFLEEARAAASLQHRNIVTIYEVGQQDGQHYFSMEYVEGRNLSELARDGLLSARRAARYLKVIAEAVHYAHQQGLLHRDLKPSNILIDAADQPRITDFGLAKQIKGGDGMTTTGQVLGSPNYLAPEQAAGRHQEVGVASDVYALGATLYHLVIGRPPFLGETVPETLEQVMNREPAPLRILKPGVPRDLETVCLKCLEKNPLRRYPTAWALSDDLDRFLNNKPVHARPVSPPEKLWRWCRRKPALAAAVLLLISLAAGSTVAAIQISAARLRAERAAKAEEIQRARAEREAESRRLFSYIADVNLAQRYLEANNFAMASFLLNSHRPAKGEKDLRGFEWRHLWRLCRGNYSVALRKHNQVLGSMEFSPDGRMLATLCWDQTLRLWRLEPLESRQPVLTLTNATGLGGFSEQGDHLVFGNDAGTIQLYHVPQGIIADALTAAGEMMAYSARGNVAVTIQPDRRVAVWDLTTRKLRFQLPDLIHRYIEFGMRDRVAASPDGRTLAVIEPESGTEGLERDRGIRLWNMSTGKPAGFLDDKRQIRSLRFSPDGNRLAVGDGEGGVNVWDLVGQGVSRIAAQDLPVHALAFSPDGRTLASGSSDGRIQFWDLVANEEQTNRLRGHVGEVSALAFSPDAKRIASGSRNSPVRIWNLDRAETADRIRGLYTIHYGNFTFSPDGRRMAAGCNDKTVKVWDAETLSVIKVFPGMNYVVAFDADSNHLLAAGPGGVLPHWWDVRTDTGEPLPTYRGALEAVYCVDLSPDRRIAALGREDGKIELLEVKTGKRLGFLEGHSDRVRTVSFGPDGNTLVSGGSDRASIVWDVNRRISLGAKIEHKAAVCAAVISHDGKLLASGCGAGTIKIWDPANLNQGSLRSITAHKSAIRTLDFSRDGRTLASGGEDKTVHLWNPVSEREVATFRVGDEVRLLKFSPNDDVLAVVTDDGVLTLLRAINLKEADEEAASILP